MKRSGLLIAAISIVLAVPSVAIDADAVYLGGRIYTVNDSQPWVDAVAIRDGQFVALGSNEEIRQLIGAGTQIVDLAGAMAMPGIHDAHTHLSYSGLKWTYECRLPLNPQLQEIVSALTKCRAERPADPWLVAGEFNPNVLPGGKIDNDFLDEAFPTTPVYLYDYSIHHGLANSAALKLAGVDKNTKQPEGGRIIRDSFTGEPTGELVETATALVSAAIPAYPSQVYTHAVRWAVAVANRYGITSVQEASATRETLAAFKTLDEAGVLSMNIAAHLVWDSPKFGAGSRRALEHLIGSRESYRTPHVDVDFVKVWMDGAPLPPHPTQAGIGVDGEIDTSKLLISEKVLTKKLLEWERAGMAAKIHVAGEGAARTALNAIRAVRNKNGPSRLRHGLAHAGFLSPQDMPRFKELGVDAEMSPAIWHLTGALAMTTGFQFKTLSDFGARIVIGSDWIITPNPNLFPALGGMLDRGEESVDLTSALLMMTLNGVAAIGREADLGSIEIGKLANMIVLNQNLFAIPKERIAETKVVRTIFEGRVVFERSTLAQSAAQH